MMRRMDPRGREFAPIDVKALMHFLARSQGQLLQMQSRMSDSPIVDPRALHSMIQCSREIALGAEVAGLRRIARAADAIERLANEALGATVLDPIGFAA